MLECPSRAQVGAADERDIICLSPAGFPGLCPLGVPRPPHGDIMNSTSVPAGMGALGASCGVHPPDPSIFQSLFPLAPIPSSHEDTECVLRKGPY